MTQFKPLPMLITTETIESTVVLLNVFVNRCCYVTFAELHIWRHYFITTGPRILIISLDIRLQKNYLFIIRITGWPRCEELRNGVITRCWWRNNLHGKSVAENTGNASYQWRIYCISWSNCPLVLPAYLYRAYYIEPIYMEPIYIEPMA